VAELEEVCSEEPFPEQAGPAHVGDPLFQRAGEIQNSPRSRCRPCSPSRVAQRQPFQELEGFFSGSRGL
jgi:hypothetical protein